MNQVKIFFADLSFKVELLMNTWFKENDVEVITVSYSVFTNTTSPLSTDSEQKHRAMLVYKNRE
jgi:hypothetical protein